MLDPMTDLVGRYSQLKAMPTPITIQQSPASEQLVSDCE
jgi:hypothetical protein